MKELTVTYQINEEQEARLNTLLTAYQNFFAGGKTKLLSHLTIEGLFQVIMSFDSKQTIDDNIKLQELIWKI